MGSWAWKGTKTSRSSNLRSRLGHPSLASPASEQFDLAPYSRASQVFHTMPVTGCEVHTFYSERFRSNDFSIFSGFGSLFLKSCPRTVAFNGFVIVQPAFVFG